MHIHVGLDKSGYQVNIFLISSQNQMLWLGPNTCIHWTSNYSTGIVFIGNMLSWLGFHNFVQ